MRIRPFQPGDEEQQAAVYNAAAGPLPGFKPASADDVRRRTRARAFDPGSRVYAEDGGRVVGYCTLEPSQGRASVPWCLPGFEAAAAPLFDALVAAARERGLTTLFAAYRRDWQPPADALVSHGFRHTREMVNYAADPVDLPTAVTAAAPPVTPLDADDLPAVEEMGRGVVRVDRAGLHSHLFNNQHFPAEAAFVLRSKHDGTPLGVGVAVERAGYADVRNVDPLAPCFRLGAFGTEGLNVKRVNGLFSFLARSPESAMTVGLALLTHARETIADGSAAVLAAQAPSDAPHLTAFYSRYFREQGRFAVYELPL